MTDWGGTCVRALGADNVESDYLKRRHGIDKSQYYAYKLCLKYV